MVRKPWDARWYLMNRDHIQTIADLELDIRTRFCLDSSRICLYLDGCWLPNTESAAILRDNDAVTIR